MSTRVTNDKLLAMINHVDEKVDDLAQATSHSFNSIGPDVMKLAIQVITVVSILIDKGIVNEEEFKSAFLEMATKMNEASEQNASNELEDIEV